MSSFIYAETPTSAVRRGAEYILHYIIAKNANYHKRF